MSRLLRFYHPHFGVKLNVFIVDDPLLSFTTRQPDGDLDKTLQFTHSGNVNTACPNGRRRWYYFQWKFLWRHHTAKRFCGPTCLFSLTNQKDKKNATHSSQHFYKVGSPFTHHNSQRAGSPTHFGVDGGGGWVVFLFLPPLLGLFLPHPPPPPSTGLQLLA